MELAMQEFNEDQIATICQFKGFEFSGDLITEFNTGRRQLLIAGLGTTDKCAYHCIYCYNKSGEERDQQLSLSESLNVLSQFIDLGAVTILLGGFGEPFEQPSIKEMIDFNYQRGVKSLLFTNASLIDSSLADFLKQHQASLVVKLDSVDEAVYNELTGTSGNLPKVIAAIRSLRQAGFTAADLTVCSVITALNAHLLADVARFGLEHGVSVFFDELEYTGRSIEPGIRERLYIPLPASRSASARVFGALQKGLRQSINKGGEGCATWHYGIVIDNQGFARVCFDEPLTDIGNVREHAVAALVEKKHMLYPFRRCIDGECPKKRMYRLRAYPRIDKDEAKNAESM
jgi:MoaA/NifB/PqqE/SkfB family radical SAM enzyme